MPYRERYRQPGFIQDAIGNRDPPHSGNPQKCRHRVVRPLLTRFGCTHCGKTHSEPRDCAIIRYHTGERLLQSDAKVLAMFPCEYCDAQNHSTKMCFTMHSFCPPCGRRGHRPFTVRGRMVNPKQSAAVCHITEERASVQAERFESLSGDGLHTGKSTAMAGGWWGTTVPENHICPDEYWSSTDDEDEQN